jgi:hypothetical protein
LIFMQDSAPAHVSRDTIQDLEERGIVCIRWPAFSPDLNPIFLIFFLIHTAYKSRRLWQKGLGQMDSFQRDPPFCLWYMLILILYPRFTYDTRHTRKYKAHACEGQRFLALNHRPVSGAFGLSALLNSTIIDIHPEVLLPLSQRKKPTGYPWEGKL